MWSVTEFLPFPIAFSIAIKTNFCYIETVSNGQVMFVRDVYKLKLYNRTQQHKVMKHSNTIHTSLFGKRFFNPHQEQPKMNSIKPELSEF